MTDRKKTLLVLNPVAGKQKGKKNFDSIHAALKKGIEELDIKISEYPGHLLEIGKEAVAEGYKRIISIGGDGTPFDIINGVYSAGKPSYEIEYGMIPAGTGNSFLRDFDDCDPAGWVQKIIAGRKIKVDLVEFTYYHPTTTKQQKKYYLNIMGIGLIADVLKLTNEKLKFLGALGYSAAVLIRLFKGMNNRMTLTVDGRQHQLKNSALVISNSKYTGGSMKIAPMADTADGKVDAVVFNEVNRREILDIFSKVFKGTHIDHPRVKVFSGTTMSFHAEPQQLLMADGDLLGMTPMTLRVLPKEISLFV